MSFINRARTAALVPAVALMTTAPAFAQAVANPEYTGPIEQMKTDATAIIGILVGVAVAVAGFLLFRKLANKAG